MIEELTISEMVAVKAIYRNLSPSVIKHSVIRCLQIKINLENTMLDKRKTKIIAIRAF